MEKTEVTVCVRPYVHDVVDKITRKPTFKKSTGEHIVSYKGRKYPLANSGAGYIIWVDEE